MNHKAINPKVTAVQASGGERQSPNGQQSAAGPPRQEPRLPTSARCPADVCPECGQRMQPEGRCFVCLACGCSKCG